MEIKMNLGENSYIITVLKGALLNADKIFNLKRRVLVVTDDGVPEVYGETIKKQCREGYVLTLPQGENTKSFECLQKILSVLTEHNFKRSDCVVAVGGGVVGDLAGFAASCYMRGIDFYNVPTTTLSQIDSSIGGKCAINFNGIKNIIGAFYQPKGVLVDTDVLKTLDDRTKASGLAEAVKMAATCDKELFELLEKDEFDLEEVIIKSLLIKKNVVEQDEKEAGLRKVLNFGHTVGHGIESYLEGKAYHGECVARGMEYMCSGNIKTRIKNVCKKIGIKECPEINREKVLDILSHDKKAGDSGISAVWVDEIGKFTFKTLTLKEIEEIL